MYLVLKNIHAQRANFQQTPYLVSPAPVFAATMLGHAISARLEVRDLGVGIVHHYARPHLEGITDKNGGTYSYASQFIGATSEGESKSPRGNPLMPVVTGDIKLSLIAKLDLAIDLDEVRREIRKMGIRLAGGIVPHAPSVLEAEDLGAAIRLCGRGFWVSDATPKVKERLGAGMSIVESVMGRVDDGWHVPAVLGYRALTRFEQRPGARDGLEHAYGEAMAGLVRYDSIHTILEGNIYPGLWSYQWVNPSTFIVHQKGTNNG